MADRRGTIVVVGVIAIAITTAKYLTPNGTDINKVGVKPDVVVEAPDMIELGDLKKDVQLTKALDVMRDKLRLGRSAFRAASYPRPAWGEG